jgi:hypothetical protein
MSEMTLTFQYTPFDLVRVGLTPDRAVYLRLRPETTADFPRLNGDEEPIWTDGVHKVFVKAYRDRLEFKMVIPCEDEPRAQVVQAA